jgi:uncharacterized OsmC-like protein
MTHTGNELIVRKLEERKADAPTSLKEKQSRQLSVSLTAESLEGMRKRAEVTLEQPVGSRWEILCDEGAYLAGDDTAPPPLAYFAVGIGFCLITQLSRFARIARLDVNDIRLEQTARFFMEGSALDGTMHGGGVGLETRVHVESDEPPERIQELIRMGEQTCFCHGSMREPVPSEIRATLNGRELELTDRPAEHPVAQ